ncbi:MAG: hypothetical protein ACP6IY_19685 [Promethearchaeia archaeon]
MEKVKESIIVLDTRKAPYYYLGKIARRLNNYFNIMNEEDKFNIIIKNMPHFIDWIEKSRTNSDQLLKLYNFLNKRFNIYLPDKKIRFYKNAINNQAKGLAELDSSQIERYKKLKRIYQDIKNYFDEIKDFFQNGSISNINYSQYAFLYFLQGYDDYIKGGDKFIESWIEDTFINERTEYKLAFILGRYYYRVAERELQIINNLGLSKDIFSWLKNIRTSNFLKLFKRITISYFHSLRKDDSGFYGIDKNDKEERSYFDHLVRYRKIIEDLFIELESNKNEGNISEKFLSLCFMAGFLIRRFPDNISMGKYDQLNIPIKNDVYKMIYDLGSLVRRISEYEVNKFGSHSYKNVITKFKDLNYNSIAEFLRYISKILIRNWLANAYKYVNNVKNTDHNHISYNWSDLYHRAMLNFLKLYRKSPKFDKHIGSITFMISYTIKSIS